MLQAKDDLQQRTDLSAGVKAAIELKAEDIDASDFPDASFDVILCCSAMQYFPDIPKVLAGLYRWLRTDGTLLFNVTAATERVRTHGSACMSLRLYVAHSAVAVHGVTSLADGHRQSEMLKAIIALRDCACTRAQPHEALASIRLQMHMQCTCQLTMHKFSSSCAGTSARASVANIP